jgi:predicted small lipoprotein YifL
MKRTFLTATALVVVATLAGCALFYPNMGSNETPSDPMNPAPTSSQTPEPTESESPSVAAKELAKPRVDSYEIASGNLQIIGEVINFAEDGGECIATFYAGNTPLATERVKAEPNVSRTQCFPISISLSKLPKGIGHIILGYESEKYQGESEKFEVIIP